MTTSITKVSSSAFHAVTENFHNDMILKTLSWRHVPCNCDFISQTFITRTNITQSLFFLHSGIVLKTFYC